MPTSEPFSAPDPVLFDIPLESPAQFSNMVFREIAYSPGGQGNRKRAISPNFHLVKLFMLDSQLALHESLYRIPRNEVQGDEDVEKQDGEGYVLGVGKIIRQFSKRNEKVHHDDFVVDDWDESAAVLPSRRPEPQAPRRPSAASDLFYTLDFGQIYQVATGHGHGPSDESFTDLLQTLEAGIPNRVLDTRFKRQTM